MKESEYTACEDAAAMLHFLRSDGDDGMGRFHASDRKLRLFAAACCRQIWPLLTDPRSRRAVEVAEQHADGRATVEELIAADAVIAADAASAWSSNAAVAAWSSIAWSPVAAARDAANEAARSTTADRSVNAWFAARKTQAALLREIFGNPFQPVRSDPSWLSWNDGAVRKLAEVIYEGCAFDRMPVLCDALEDAGCADEAVLTHCRTVATGRTIIDVLEMRKNAVAGGCCNRFADYLPCDCLEEARRQPPPHVRGCFVLDALLNKE